MKVWVIQNKLNENEYWNSHEGWTNLDGGDTYSNEEINENTVINGMWVRRARRYSVQKKDEVERILIDMWASIGMGIPENYEDIVQEVYEDVCENGNVEDWNDVDVASGLKRWMESQHNNDNVI